VYGLLAELGQGIQHVASRVEDLVAFVQRGNDYREITGEVRRIHPRDNLGNTWLRRTHSFLPHYLRRASHFSTFLDRTTAF
jgi:hypothetical protein